MPGMLSSLALDARHLLRSLRRSPLFALIAVLTIALGIGVTTAVVSMADHVLVRGLPFRDSGRLMMMLERDESGALRTPSAPTARDWQRDPGVAHAFDGVTFVRGDVVRLRIAETTETILTAFVAPEFFPILGAQPALGRLPAADEYRAGAPRVVVLSHRAWTRRFAADPMIVGRTIEMDSIPTTVVGVLPGGAVYPGFADIWMPTAHYRRPDVLEQRGLHADSRTIARLRPGVDSARAAALMQPVAARLGVDHPRDQEGWTPAMRPLRDEIVGDVEPMLLTLAGAAAAVLLLVCANIASLLLARLTTRTRELAIRGALGASRARLVAQLVTESFLLASIGGAIGMAFAAACIDLAKTFGATRLPRVEELVVDYRVLGIAAATTLITALLCGVWPAIRATRQRSGDALRASASGSVGIRAETRMRRVLVTVQFALAVVLLVGAGLLVQSFRRAATVDVGFDPAGVVTLRIDPPTGAYPSPEDAAALYARLMDAARAVPGVTDAAFINHPPFGTASMVTSLEIEGRSTGDSPNRVLYRTVSAGYLTAMRMSVVGGRWFDEADIGSRTAGFVINESMARRYWPGESPVGRRITVTRASQARADFGQPLAGTVIGVIGDVHQWAPDVEPAAEVYVPYTLETWPWGTLVVRTRAGAPVIPALGDAIRAVDRRLMRIGAAGDAQFTLMAEAISGSLQPRKVSTSLIAAFAVCALILAAMGMYGVVAHNVAQRTREIGVRKALGATDGAIVSLVLRESAAVIAAGVVVGCVGAWAGARLIESLLFATRISDPFTYLATIVLLVGVALVATLLPARHAMRLNPTVAMRAE